MARAFPPQRATLAAKSFFALAEPVEPRPFTMPQPQGEEPWRTLDL
ncbi:MAG: hypothetical protein K2Y37_07770 [Pirellulales bacterium]|nr:hypothetical protein [Pirellulales bacterium]